MNSDIPPPEKLADMSENEQAQIKKIMRRLETVITICLEDGLNPGLLANVLLACAAKIIGCLDPVARARTLRVLRQNFPLMVEEYAVSNRKHQSEVNGGR